LAYIYILTNKINNKKYVGQTTQKINRRLKRHELSNENQFIHKAIKKYGWNNFKKFYFWCPEFLLDFFEKVLIKILNTIVDNKKGYNLTYGGNSKKHLSENVKLKISKFNKGKKISEEQKVKISKARKGIVFTEEHKKNISKFHADVSGSKNGHARKVICLETREVFGSIREASDKYKIGQTNISSCCSGKVKTSGGYHWLYFTEGMQLPTKEELEEIIKKEKEDLLFIRSNCQKGKMMGKENPIARKIICTETNEIFECINEAKRKYGFNSVSISRCCSGKQEMTGGYHWMYYEDYLKLKEAL
jgi:group I intron endonuclease